MIRARLALAVLGTALAILPACGGGSGGGGSIVDNSTCRYGSSSAGPYSPNPPATNHVPDHAQVIPEMPHEHVAPPARVTYVHNPPTSGCHYSLAYGQAPITAGAYPPTPVIPPEYWVHNLEHGYIAVLYNCPTGCDADLHALQAWMQAQKPDPGLVAIAKSDPTFKPYTKVIVIPWPTMSARFAAISWDYYDPMSRVDLTELQHFYDDHVGHSPEGLATP